MKFPSGSTWILEGRIHVRLEVRGDSVAKLREAIERTRKLDADYYFVPESVEDVAGGLHLTYPAEPAGTDAALESERVHAARDKELSVPRWLALGRFLLRAATSRKKAGVQLLPVTPLWLRRLPVKDFAWRLIAVPVLEQPLLADWARADEDAWVWAPLAPESDTYSVAAVLCSCIAGELHPPRLSRAEKFRRTLRGHLGLSKPLRDLVHATLPLSMAVDGDVLVDFVRAHLDVPGTLELAGESFGKLEQALSIRRIAGRFEYAGDFDVALRLLAWLAETGSADDGAWQAVARLCELKKDAPAALDAAKRALEENPGEAVWFVRLLRRLARSDALGRDVLRGGVYAVDAAVGPNQTEDLALEITALEAHYLGAAPERALGRIPQRCSVPWNEAVRLMLNARMTFETRDYPQVSRFVKEARAIIGKIPDRGGRLGKYVESYLLLLDGIANYAAVGVFANPAFWGDAYQRLVSAVDLAFEAGAGDVSQSAIAWLIFIEKMASQIPNPQLELMRTGIRAYLLARGVTVTDELVPPAIPWPDEDVLFPN